MVITRHSYSSALSLSQHSTFLKRVRFGDSFKSKIHWPLEKYTKALSLWGDLMPQDSPISTAQTYQSKKKERTARSETAVHPAAGAHELWLLQQERPRRDEAPGSGKQTLPTCPDGQLGRTYFRAPGDFPAQVTRLLSLVTVRSEEREVTQDAGESRFLFCWRRWVSKSWFLITRELFLI